MKCRGGEEEPEGGRHAETEALLAFFRDGMMHPNPAVFCMDGKWRRNNRFGCHLVSARAGKICLRAQRAAIPRSRTDSDLGAR